MKHRYFIYIFFFVFYFSFWGLVPLEKDPLHVLSGNTFCSDCLIRTWYVVTISAILGLIFIDLIFLARIKIGNRLSRWVAAIVFCVMACFSFFISGQNIEVSCNGERVEEYLWFFKIRTVVARAENDTNDSLHIINNFKDEGCFRCYNYGGKERKVFRGFGFACNLTEEIH